ncbi:type II toxin-antitoxin system HipA family toxin [Ramlibacter albus]|uniref:Type II toxin-antitoxin system HipA family toxin n=1 Tax=Ramlibacter albus TaxID=2079448 RepID=A0A923MAJ4_9BURK|nr:type II toxin-antitoxin system HipA family toxin [Ramlibacter albus]MBC5765941.1 type II toxin-antitoxin system HipA family toxin [Ramlibacter albus]
MLPAKIRLLDVNIAGQQAGLLQHASQYSFTYRKDDPAQRPVGLLMPASRLEYRDTALFPVMDQNLPEGFLLHRLREVFPKQQITPMHLLALIGTNGIGHLGFRLPDAEASGAPKVISRETLLNAKADAPLFEELVRAYLSTGIGVSGLQPKILVPDRSTWAVPNLIVKAAAASYPGISANEYVCLQAAQRAGIAVPSHELSANGELLVIDRFDLGAQAERFGFEDIASLMGLQVRDVLSERKYVGSYESVAELLQLLQLRRELPKFFEQVAFSVMVRNGDAHLKNFGVLYTGPEDARLAPMFDVVTTSIYEYRRFSGGPPMEDHTMALKLFKGRHESRVYPATADLLRFGTRVCRVSRPVEVIQRIADGMSQALAAAANDPRVPRDLLEKMSQKWERGFDYAREASRAPGA